MNHIINNPIRSLILKGVLLTLLVASTTVAVAAVPEFFKKVEFAPQIGTDFGAAVPFPISNVPAGAKSLAPSFHISPAIRIAYRFDEKWAVGLDAAYKTVGSDIQARVTNQKFNDNGNLAFFTGIADMNMKFAMFELPLYLRFTHPGRKSRFMLGYYVGLWTYSSFKSIARKGYIGGEPDHVSSIVTGEGVNMDFTQFLRSAEHGITAGYEYCVSRRLSAGARFNLGLSDIFPKNVEYFDYSFLPIRVGFMVSYRLF